MAHWDAELRNRVDDGERGDPDIAVRLRPDLEATSKGMADFRQQARGWIRPSGVRSTVQWIAGSWRGVLEGGPHFLAFLGALGWGGPPHFLAANPTDRTAVTNSVPRNVDRIFQHFLCFQKAKPRWNKTRVC